MLCKEDSKEGSKTMNFLIIGGDDRLVELANIFSGKGYNVYTYGMEKAADCQAKNFNSLDEAISECNVIKRPYTLLEGDEQSKFILFRG